MLLVAGIGLKLAKSDPAFTVEKVEREIYGRLQIFGSKLIGRLPEFSWGELIRGLWPAKHLGGAKSGSGFISIEKFMEGRGWDASVINRLDDQESIQNGRELFVANCSPCHGRDGQGGHAPSLAKANYRAGASDFALYKVLRDGIEGTAMNSFPLSIDDRWRIIGFLRTLQKDPQSELQSEIPKPDLKVTWTDLLEAKNRPGSWLTYSGSLDGWHHAAMNEITAANASALKLLWVHQFTAPGDLPIAATPIVAGNSIFLSVTPGEIASLNATTGKEIWRYSRTVPSNLPTCCGPVNRGLAVLGDTVFAGTLDSKLIALDAKNGAIRWETIIADPKDGYTITVAPLVVRDMVIIGVSGGEFGARGFLAAYSVTDGKLRWRFDTIPGPGEPGHDTWKNDAWKMGGGPTWITGSYDPDLDLLYWGVGNPAPEFAGGLRPGDNLYTNSVIALKADTGKLAWYFQFTPHDEHDWDASQTPILADIDVAGSRRKAICWANRNGFYYVLDRTNGEFLTGKAYVELTWASGLDGKGRPVLTSSAITESGVVTKPWVGGGTNWQPPSFDPATSAVFVHATEGASIYSVSPAKNVARGTGGIYVGGGTATSGLIVNCILSLDASTGDIRWKYAAPRTSNPPTRTGVLSTSGGVVFSASDGIVFALDAKTGSELWRSDLGGGVMAAPISFLLDGKQVVAFSAGRSLFVFGL